LEKDLLEFLEELETRYQTSPTFSGPSFLEPKLLSMNEPFY